MSRAAAWSIPLATPPEAWHRERRGMTRVTSRSAAEIEAVLGLLPDPVVVLDESMCVVAANAAAERFFARRVEEFHRATAARAPIHPDDLPLMLSSFEEVLTKDVGTPVEPRPCRRRWMEARREHRQHAPPRHRRVAGQHHRDLTQRRRWEVAAAQPERFRSVVESAAVVLMLLDQAGSIHSVSAPCAALGHEPDTGRRFAVDGMGGRRRACGAREAQRRDPHRRCDRHRGIAAPQGRPRHPVPAVGREPPG